MAGRQNRGRYRWRVAGIAVGIGGGLRYETANSVGMGGGLILQVIETPSLSEISSRLNLLTFIYPFYQTGIHRGPALRGKTAPAALEAPTPSQVHQ